MIVEDVASVGAFSVCVFTLAMVKGQGAQVVRYFLCATNGDVADGIGFVVVPDAETVAKIRVEVYRWIRNEWFGHHFETQCPVQREALDVLLVRTSFFMGKEIPAPFVCL